MLESVTKAAVAMGVLLGLAVILSGHTQVGAVILIVSGFSWLICQHINKLAEAHNKAEAEVKKPRMYGTGFMGAPGKKDAPVIDELLSMASKMMDKDLARVKEAAMNPKDFNESIHIIVTQAAHMVVPLITYPGIKMQHPKTMEYMTPAEAAGMITKNFDHALTDMVKIAAQGQEKGILPSSLEELKKIQEDKQ